MIMHFANPHILHLLWLMPVLAWALHALHARREKTMARFIQADLLPPAARGFYRRRGRSKAFLVLFCFLCAVLALARPQWGYELREVKRRGLDILIAVDVSKSMLTQDVSPNRLERTKLAIKDLIRKLKGDRVGLIAFAGEAFLVCPLTVDYNGFLLSLNDLNVETIPRGGTDLSSAIEEAIKGYGDKGQPYKTAILVTDGEDQEGDCLKAAGKAKGKGVTVYTVGVGTREGDLIRVQNEQGQWEFLKDSQGNYIKSRLNENLLQQIAYITGGAYVRSSGAQFGLDYLYDQQLAAIEKHDIDSKIEKKYHEQFQWFLAAALIALMAEAALPAW
ncbi:MAG: VWA domain-containing protein, partial [Candidatus Omnitrophica bacterium]|nr:VWA domain-containing protein [Candidatus Omnitrophota bacterium]